MALVSPRPTRKGVMFQIIMLDLYQDKRDTQDILFIYKSLD
jgi:hypothetical protein